MDRPLLAALAASSLLAAAAGAAHGDETGPQHGIVIGANRYLASGADAIRSGHFDEGIRLTQLGLDRSAVAPLDRAAGYANLCAAYVSKEDPDTAIPYCTKSIELYDGNWRAYSNRSHAYYLKGMFAEAAADNEAAAAISPKADHVEMIRERLNELSLQPRVIMQDHK